MNNLIKYLPVSMLWDLMTLGLIRLGNSLKDKDDNETGNDDAAGNVLIAIAPVIPVIADPKSGESIKKKVMHGAYNALGSYLGYPPREVPK